MGVQGLVFSEDKKVKVSAAVCGTRRHCSCRFTPALPWPFSALMEHVSVVPSGLPTSIVCVCHQN